MQLITIPFSHFCEKARWGLDRAGFEYREVRFAPVVQRLAVTPFRATTTPLLIDGTNLVRESSDILRFADESLPEPARLYPEDADQRAEMERFVERFDEGIGPDIRLFFYSWATETPERLLHFGSNGLPSNQRVLMRATLPAITQGLKFHFAIKAETHKRCEEAVDLEFDYVSDLLADGRRYLVGDRFSAADLSFASFVGQFVGAQEYGADSFSPLDMPEELVEQGDRWEQSAAGQWALRLYAEHRYERADRPAAS